MQLDRAAAILALCFRKTLMRWQFHDGDAVQNGEASAQILACKDQIRNHKTLLV